MEIQIPSKKFGGFDIKIFSNPINPDFICTICNNVVRQPKECTVCGTLYCESCLKQWEERNRNNTSECPMRCKKNDLRESIMRPIGKVIKNILYTLQVKCPNENCNKIMNLEQYESHEEICGLPKCQNEKCLKPSEKLIIYKDNDNGGNEYKFCSEMCKYSFIFQQISKKLKPEELCDWFHNFVTNTINENLHKDCNKRINNLKNMIKAISGNNQISINDLDYSPGITEFKWDNENKGQGIQIYNNGESLFLNESCYAFRSIVSNKPFMNGVHYFEIIADRRTENELKIGITKNINFNYDTSFSDYDFGWAFYGIGQLRHSNNATGINYGKKFKKNGTLGVFLDMNKGILSFALDGEYFGIGFQSEDLKEGPIYAAISLLHVGGCTLQTNIPAPPYFFSDY